MQEKNEIKAENFDDKLMLKEKEKQYELFPKYFEYDNKIMLTLTNLREENNKFYRTYLENPNLDKIKNTPIFYLCEILNEMNLKELESSDSLSTLFEKKSEINKLMEKFSNPEKNYKIIKSSIENLKKIYERIEGKIVDEYIKEHYKEEGEKINRNNDINLDEEITKAEKLEKEMEKLIPSHFPNELLKQIIKKMSELPELIGEKDDEEKKILNEIKEEINSIMKDSESGEISKKWNFNDPKLKRLDMGYFFKVIGDKHILLDDTKKEEKDRKKKQEYLIILKEEDADNIIDQMMDKIHNLPLYERIKDTPKIRKLINKLLYINDNKEKPAEPISKEETEELKKLLVNLGNIKFFIRLVNYLRSNIETSLEKNEFDIMVNILENIASFCLKNRDREIFYKLMTISKTYYLGKKGEKNKIHIFNKIKEHDIFKDIACWEIYLYYSLFIDESNKKYIDKIEKGENLSDKEIASIANSISTVLIEAYTFGNSKESFKNLIKRTINRFPERYKEQIQKMIL